jgi:DNA-binding IclR family transcriptional regulator
MDCAATRARELHIADPTARRILKRLAADGYVARENRPHGRYVVSARIVDLGERAKRQIAAYT